MSPLLQVVIGFALGLFAICAAGSMPDAEVEFNGRALPSTPRWWIPRGLVLFGIFCGMLLMFALMVVLFPVAMIHDLLFPKRPRWYRNGRVRIRRER